MMKITGYIVVKMDQENYNIFDNDLKSGWNIVPIVPK